MAFNSVKILFVILVVQGTIVTCADISYLNDTIRNYFADTRLYYPPFSDYKARAKEFIFKEFERFGLDTEYQTFIDYDYEFIDSDYEHYYAYYQPDENGLRMGYDNNQRDNYTGRSLALLSHETKGDTLVEHFKRSWEAQRRRKYQIEWFKSSNISRDFNLNEHIPEVYITDSGILRGAMKECQQCDNLEVMLTDDNLQYLGKTADSLARTINELSGAIDTNGKEKNSPRPVTIITVAAMLCSRWINP